MAKFSRIGLFGRSQSGKSTIMDRILRGHRRCILFDALPTRAPSAAAQGYTHVTHINDLIAGIQANYWNGFRYWFQPEDEEDHMVLSLSDVSKFLIDYQNQMIKQYGADGTPEVTLAVDEMADCFPNYSLPKKLNGFSRMCRSGRHSRIHLVGATQRPVNVSTNFRGQLEKRFLFNLPEPADLRIVAEMGGFRGRQLAEAVSRLLPLEYIRMENGQYTKGKLTFPG